MKRLDNLIHLVCKGILDLQLVSVYFRENYIGIIPFKNVKLFKVLEMFS